MKHTDKQNVQKIKQSEIYNLSYTKEKIEILKEAFHLTVYLKNIATKKHRISISVNENGQKLEAKPALQYMNIKQCCHWVDSLLRRLIIARMNEPELEPKDHVCLHIQESQKNKTQRVRFMQVKPREKTASLATKNSSQGKKRKRTSEEETKYPVNRNNFSCTLCDSTFSGASGLWYHEKRYHNRATKKYRTEKSINQ
jgi:hypothetical protein